MSGETRQERNDRLEAELDALTERLEQVRRELKEGAGEETPEERRRRFRLVGGELTGVAALVAAPAVYARRHGRDVAIGIAAAAGGAGLAAAALMSHPAATPYSAPPPATARPAPTASARPAPTGPPKPRHTPSPPPVFVPSARRRTGTATPSPGETTPTPAPSGPPPTPTGTPPTPSPLPTCPLGVVVSLGQPFLYVCV